MTKSLELFRFSLKKTNILQIVETSKAKLLKIRTKIWSQYTNEIRKEISHQNAIRAQNNSTNSRVTASKKHTLLFHCVLVLHVAAFFLLTFMYTLNVNHRLDWVTRNEEQIATIMNLLVALQLVGRKSLILIDFCFRAIWIGRFHAEIQYER